MTVGRANYEASGRSVWKVSCAMGAAAAAAPNTSHPQGSGSQLVIGGSRSKHIPVSLFVLWHRGVYPAPQRHSSLLWAVARSHGGGQGMAAYWHPHCCPLNTLGERKGGSLLGWHCFESWECSSFAEGSGYVMAGCFLCIADIFISSAHERPSRYLPWSREMFLNKLSSSRTARGRMSYAQRFKSTDCDTFTFVRVKGYIPFWHFNKNVSYHVHITCSCVWRWRELLQAVSNIYSHVCGAKTGYFWWDIVTSPTVFLVTGLAVFQETAGQSAAMFRATKTGAFNRPWDIYSFFAETKTFFFNKTYGQVSAAVVVFKTVFCFFCLNLTRA